jgi:diacylglycerol kinase family enzyme
VAGIGLILNPRAKQTLADPELGDRLARILGDEGVVRRAASLDELRRVVEEFKHLGIELVAVAGGDGTNHVTISGLVEAYVGAKLPYFGMLRSGTMNTVANSFGIPRKKPEVLLERCKRAYLGRALTPMRFVEPNVLRVGSHYGFIFGTGCIYGFIAEYNEREDRSAGWAAQVLGRAIASAAVGGATIKRVAQRWSGTVRFDDGSCFPDRDYLTIGASTCGQIGLGFKPFYRAGELPDRFHVLGITTTALGFIRGLPRVWTGRTLGGEKTYERVTDRMVLEPRGDGVAYMLDGDVYVSEGPLEVASGPRIRIVIP